MLKLVTAAPQSAARYTRRCAGFCMVAVFHASNFAGVTLSRLTPPFFNCASSTTIIHPVTFVFAIDPYTGNCESVTCPLSLNILYHASRTATLSWVVAAHESQNIRKNVFITSMASALCCWMGCCWYTTSRFVPVSTQC